jgi:hypothetical protein
LGGISINGKNCEGRERRGESSGSNDFVDSSVEGSEEGVGGISRSSRTRSRLQRKRVLAMAEVSHREGEEV